jgi:hypothetical protein
MCGSSPQSVSIFTKAVSNAFGRAIFWRPLKETNACLGKCRETFRRLLINAVTVHVGTSLASTCPVCRLIGSWLHPLTSCSSHCGYGHAEPETASKIETMSRTVLISILILAAPSSAISQNVQPSSTAFHWLDSSKDAALFERIKTAFTEELKPDDPEKVKPIVAQEYKWISRVGVFETSALVLIGERETRTAKYGNYFVAYNYDLKNGEKTSLTSFNKGFTEWKFKKLIRFDSSRAPDIVFTHPSCNGCEADYLLSSFFLDSTDAKWKVRTWSEKSTEILIGSDYSVGTEEDSKYDCLLKFADFNGDGFDDLAVRCIAITEQGKILEDTTTIYTVLHGQAQIFTVKDRQQLATIRDQLCADAKKSKLCPSK